MIATYEQIERNRIRMGMIQLEAMGQSLLRFVEEEKSKFPNTQLIEEGRKYQSMMIGDMTEEEVWSFTEWMDNHPETLYWDVDETVDAYNAYLGA